MKNEFKFSSHSYKFIKFITVKMKNLEKSYFVAQRNFIVLINLKRYLSLYNFVLINYKVFTLI